MNIKPTKTLALILIAFILGGCSWLSPYQQSIQQGNILDSESIEQLQVGMTQEQVLYLLGSPLLTAPNNSQQWDYIYQIRLGQKLVTRETLRLHFETSNQGMPRLAKFDHHPSN